MEALYKVIWASYLVHTQNCFQNAASNISEMFNVVNGFFVKISKFCVVHHPILFKFCQIVEKIVKNYMKLWKQRSYSKALSLILLLWPCSEVCGTGCRKYRPNLFPMANYLGPTFRNDIQCDYYCTILLHNVIKVLSLVFQIRTRCGQLFLFHSPMQFVLTLFFKCLCHSINLCVLCRSKTSKDCIANTENSNHVDAECINIYNF